MVRLYVNLMLKEGGKKKRQNKLKRSFCRLFCQQSTAIQKEEAHIHSFFLHLGRKRAVK